MKNLFIKRSISVGRTTLKSNAILLSTLCVLSIVSIQCGSSGDTKIDTVYFAQKHVLEPDNKLFKLISNLDALIKVHVVSPSKSEAPPVTATLKLKGKTLSLELAGPVTLPDSIPNGPGIIQHSFDNSFTAIIPKEWVQPGLSINVKAGEQTKSFDNLKVGAPSKILMTMFDVHYFDYSPGDYPEGWKDEVEAKWPTSELELRRIPKVIFPELIIPPRGKNLDIPAVRIASKDEYTERTGLKFDGEQGAALAWMRALKEANGIKGRYSFYYVNIYGAHAGGQAWDFGGVGNGNSEGVFIHECGHGFLLPHWVNDKDYPYKGDMFGIKAPEESDTHAGPTWAFDLPSKSFIAPTIQENAVKGKKWENIVGEYKLDPMQGGGFGDQEKEYIFRHFSDYSMYNMQQYCEDSIVVWNDDISSYASWNEQEGAYTKFITNNGVEYPVERDVEVISVMAATCDMYPQATLVYPPIGPYSTGIIKTFDPTVEADRNEAKEIFCKDGGCDLSLRVTQGGKTSLYMLRASLNPENNSGNIASLDPSENPQNKSPLKTRAVNLRASDGEVTKVELLSTPDAEINGLPKKPTVLDTWKK